MLAALRNRLDEFRLAMMILTRLPMGSWPLSSAATPARAVWAYPIAGAVVGAISGAAFYLCALAGMPSGVSAALALVTSVLASGCLHEDGLADFSDGLGGGNQRARKLEIMRDSRIGTYGTAALILSFLLRWSAVAALSDPRTVLLVWVAADALSRGSVAIPLCFLSAARSDGLGAQAASPPVWSALTAVVLPVCIAILLLGASGSPLIAAATAAAFIMTTLARYHLNGHTGDVLGACALVVESVALAAAGTRWF